MDDIAEVRIAFVGSIKPTQPINLGANRPWGTLALCPRREPAAGTPSRWFHDGASFGDDISHSVRRHGVFKSIRKFGETEIP